MTEQTKIQRASAPAHRNVYSALCAAQSEMGTVVKGAINPAFKSKYANLADVMGVVVPALTAHGIAVYHTMMRDEAHLVMRTVLHHGDSDTHIDCDVPLIVAKNDMQGMKSATTYAKRIGVESLTGIAPEDDDGNAAAKSVKDAPVVEERPAPLGDAWRDAVMDTLPTNATPRQIAEAFAEAIAMDVATKGAKALDNAWNRHKAMIGKFERDYPDLHEKVIDAFENRRNDLSEATR